jgi:hypothetical protein
VVYLVSVYARFCPHFLGGECVSRPGLNEAPTVASFCLKLAKEVESGLETLPLDVYVHIV